MKPHKYLVERLKEKSTYQGILILLGGLHYHFTDIVFDEFIGLFMLCVGLIEILVPERLD